MIPRLVFQLFVGRQASASRLHHRGHVFEMLAGQDWSRLKQNRFEWVYLLGVFNHQGPIVVNQEQGIELSGHRLPSVFAITDHTKPDPDLGDLATLKRLLARIHEQGLKVMLDFVPNHTGMDHPWFTDHPDYYLPNREFSGDVVKLDYSNDQVRQQMKSVLEQIADLGADGVRCDMAHLVPTSFWKEAIIGIKHAHPRFTFLAEAYSDSVFDWGPAESLLQSGFDGMYEEFFYRNLTALFETGAPLDHVAHHLTYLISRHDTHSYIHYLSNHDDELPGGAKPYLQALVFLLLLLPGYTLIPNGLLHGHLKRLAHHQYDELAATEHELETMPSWFTHIILVVSSLSFQLLKLTATNEGLLLAEVSIDHKPGIFVANFGKQPIHMPFGDAYMSPGIVRKFNVDTLLYPGDYEVFYQR
jgi:hypothetical protein